MLGAPIDAWYGWIGVALASLVALGVAMTAAPTPPAEAPEVAETVDTVAATDPPASARHPIEAERVRVGAHRITVEGDRSRTAVVRYGPITPAQRGTPLRAVALGDPPPEHFESPAAFRDAAGTARQHRHTIEPAGDLLVRTVAWDDVRVTLVTA